MTRFARLSYAGRCAVILLLMTCMGCAHQLNLAEGIHDFRTHHYHDAFVRLKPEALHGQRDAAYAIGYMYYYGEGIVENRPKAIYWIRRAACEGQQEAQEAMKLLEIEYNYACQRLGEKPYRIVEKTPPS